MLSVQALESSSHKFSFPTTVNPAESMITEVNRKKHPSGASRLDTDAILVILETVLQTHTHSSFPASQSHPSQLNGSKTTRCRSQTQQTLRSKSATIDSRAAGSVAITPKRSQSQPNGDITDTVPICDRIPHTGTSTAKIEKAMDSAKMELLCTVRKEVSDLQSKVASLLQHQAKLEQENQFLRSAAAPETLAKLNEYQQRTNSPTTSN